MDRALSSVAVATTELEVLEVEARVLSAERKDLHYRIDRLYQSTPLINEKLALLDRLEEREQVVSLERRDLHSRIDGLRTELGLPNWRKARLSHTPTDVNGGLRGPSPGGELGKWLET
jgi:predicted RNase H-like nuclease (RuvC/YqgF family)